MTYLKKFLAWLGVVYCPAPTSEPAPIVWREANGGHYVYDPVSLIQQAYVVKLKGRFVAFPSGVSFCTLDAAKRYAEQCIRKS